MSDELLTLLQQLGHRQADLAQIQGVISVLFFITVVSLLLTPRLARRKHLNPGHWTLTAVLFGPPLTILLVPARAPSTEDVE